ncbi:proline dehydrogenase [Cardiosporidium cionae]|uniref:Proline dehydrogenase n=1 Tax=Cardiosporidium cionae TaxID=476202 RepID=A0ABQ7JFC1_9APIC|nr:proline dehydrogenase [Cardiosporidium cionae]|eukprot:KAF8822688.1 proline dehydrogenase [Cardiosporidium cionae]
MNNLSVRHVAGSFSSAASFYPERSCSQMFFRSFSRFVGFSASPIRPLCGCLRFQRAPFSQYILFSKHFSPTPLVNSFAIYSRRSVSTSTTDVSSVRRLLNFDLEISASKKSLPQLLRAVGVLAVCRFKPIVVHAEMLLNLCKRLLGQNITLSFIRGSVFKHFCGGERMEQLKPVISSLETEGVGSVLAYSAEDDLSEMLKNSPNPDFLVWDYHSERLKESARAASAQQFGFIAIKLTAIISPLDLKSASTCIMKIHNSFGEFAGIEKSTAGFMLKDQYAFSRLTKEDFFSKAHKYIDCAEIDELFYRISSINEHEIDHSDGITYFQWMKFFSLDCLENLRLLKCYNTNELQWNEEDSARWSASFYRFKDVLDVVAQQKNVAALLDAEQSYFQPAIDVMALNLQQLLNKDRCILYNTYQSYRKDCISRATADMQRAKSFKYIFGMKLVRGAYMPLERQLAAKEGLIDPINTTLEETCTMYQKMSHLAFSNPEQIAVFFGTHNAESILYILDIMKSKGITSTKTVNFGQLLGMFDHVTFTLSHFGYNAYKYIPYGPIEDVIPYLVRRAQENSDVFSSCSEELRYFTREIFRRMAHPLRRHRHSPSTV